MSEADHDPRDRSTAQRWAVVSTRAGAEVGLDSALLGDFLPELAAAAAGSPLDSPRLDGYRACGRRAAESGAALPAVVDLYLTAARRAWTVLPAAARAIDTADLRSITEQVLAAVDDAVAALCAGYEEARRAVSRAEEALRREFVDDLLTGTADLAGLVDRSAAFGLRLETTHAVLVAAGSRPFLDHRVMVRDVEAALLARAADTNLLVATKDGLLVVVVPGADADHAARITADRLRREAGLTFRVGISRPRTGAAGVRAGFDEARWTVELADRLALAAPAVHSRDLLVYQVLTRDRESIVDLIDTVLRPLQLARGGAAPLIGTLHTYFAVGGVAVRAAAGLHLSVRAVTYRLARIRALTGLDPAQPEDRYVLETAVRGARVIGWPDGPR